MKNCTTCGAELQSHWKFCTNCQAPQPAPQDGGTAATSGAETTLPADKPAQPTQRFEQAPQPQTEQPTQRFEQASAEQQPQQQSPAQPGMPTQRFEQAPHQQQSPAQPGMPTQTTSVFDPPVVAPAGAYAQAGGSAQAAPGSPAYGAGGDGPGEGAPYSDFNGNGNGNGGPGVPPSGSGAPKKGSRKVIILVVVLVILLGLGIGAYFFVQNMFRGGAGSPEAASDKILESIESKDLIGLAGMVPPDEREPMQRLQEHFEDKFEEFGIEDALDKVGRGEEANEDEFTLDGVDVSFEGVKPEITEIDDNTALIKYTEGEVRVVVDPAATNGLLRSALEAAGDEDEEKIDETTDLAELGPDGSALTLVATQRDGRWYVSPVYSIVEMVSESEGYARGTMPDSAGGSDSPDEAARAMVEALPKVVSEGSVEPLAGSLSVHEGGLLYLYGDMFDDALSAMAGEELDITDVRFTEGDKDGDRATAVVDNITIESEYGDEITLTKDCIKGESESDSFCLNGSGYSIEPSPYMVGGLKELSLTTVKEDGKWRVSLGETFTDWAIKWTDSLNREQALALLSLTSGEDATGDITVGESTEVKFNSAGYAVLNLKLDEDMELEAEDEYDFGTMTVYSKDGKEELGKVGYGDEIPAGDYKLVVFAGYEWDEEFSEKGEDFSYSKDLTLEEYEGYSSPSYDMSDSIFGLLPLDVEPQKHTLDARDSDTELVVEINGSAGPSREPVTVVVTLDGKANELKIAPSVPGNLTLPYPGDGKEHELVVELRAGEGYDYAFLTYEAELK